MLVSHCFRFHFSYLRNDMIHFRFYYIVLYFVSFRSDRVWNNPLSERSQFYMQFNVFVDTDAIRLLASAILRSMCFEKIIRCCKKFVQLRHCVSLSSTAHFHWTIVLGVNVKEIFWGYTTLWITCLEKKKLVVYPVVQSMISDRHSRSKF